MISPATWQIAKPFLIRALAYQDDWTIDGVKSVLDAGKAQLWCGQKSCGVTELLDHQNGRVCNIWLASGELKELTEKMLPDVQAWAASKGCVKIKMSGRKGWQRVLKDFFQPHIILEKRL